jgi:hypothetical protein
MDPDPFRAPLPGRSDGMTEKVSSESPAYKGPNQTEIGDLDVAIFLLLEFIVSCRKSGHVAHPGSEIFTFGIFAPVFVGPRVFIEPPPIVSDKSIEKFIVLELLYLTLIDPDIGFGALFKPKFVPIKHF